MDVPLCRHAQTHSNSKRTVRVCQSRQALTSQLPRPVEPMKNHYCKENTVLLFHLPGHKQMMLHMALGGREIEYE